MEESNIRELYKELYNRCCRLEGFSTCAHFVAMKGKYYEESEKRLLLVGRSTNGWDSLCADNADEFSSEADRLFKDDTRWNWIENIEGTLYSKHNTTEEMRKEDRYCVSASPFWHFSSAIWDQISDRSIESDLWVENIAWSNLYKVSPKIEGNPPSDYIMAQHEVCVDILRAEIEMLKPTHIVFMTGYDWAKEFCKSIFDYIEVGDQRNICRGRNKNNVYVEAMAGGADKKAVICCRPEFRDKERYVEQVIEKFSMMK